MFLSNMAFMLEVISPSPQPPSPSLPSFIFFLSHILSQIKGMHMAAMMRMVAAKVRVSEMTTSHTPKRDDTIEIILCNLVMYFKVLFRDRYC